MPNNPNNHAQTTRNASAGDRRGKRLVALRAWWSTTWQEGGVLHRRWEELRLVRENGWHDMANWIKVTLALLGVCAAIILMDTAGGVLGTALDKLTAATATTRAATASSTGLWNVIDTPVRAYITTHSTGLAISASTVYALWQLAGLAGFIGGFLRSTAARLAWITWGVATIGAVWSATPATGRPIAVAITAVGWALASMLALRGLSLRPVIYNVPPAFQPNVEIRPEIHILAQPASLDNIRFFRP
ncbi:hypothetical protein [Streptomyces sp. CB02009]|uniref:hypothetical protein n=1 Tax=Streptomyces sp. CB02009 TaxID=1703938 RepID=UPI00093E6254|nr:hypothetical protein [Streptomyces sp. CB02009]